MAEGTTKTTTFTPEQTQQIMQMLGAGGGTGAISAPQGQENIVIKNDKFDPAQPVSPTNMPIISVPSPNAAPKPSTAAAAHFGSDTTGYWIADPTAPNGVRMVVPPKTPNADEEMKKALDRMDRQQEMTEKQANDAAGRGYMTNAEYATMASKYAGDKLGQDKLAEDIRQYNATQAESRRQFDLKQAASDKKAADDLLTSQASRGLTSAQTAKTGVETAGLQQGIEKTAALLPGEIAQQGATLAGTQATTAGTQASTQSTLEAIARANAPTVQTPQTGMYTWQRDPKTGAITPGGINPEYIPKTQAEIAARVGQINSTADAKGKEVQAKVGQTIAGRQYTADDALKEFNTWYDAQVTPQMGALQAAQQAAQFEQAKQQAEMQRQAYQTALGAGTNAISAFGAMQTGRVGPGFEAASAAASKGDFAGLANVPNATTYQAEDITKTAPQAVMDALKYISPTAASATGTPLPNYQAIDIPGQLSRLQYLQGNTAPMPAPAAPAATGAAGIGAGPNTAITEPWPGANPAAGQTYDWNALLGRLGQDQVNQIAQRGVPTAQQAPIPPAGGWTPGGGSSYSYATPPPWSDYWKNTPYIPG